MLSKKISPNKGIGSIDPKFAKQMAQKTPKKRSMFSRVKDEKERKD